MLTGLCIFVPLSLFSVFFLNPEGGMATIITLIVSVSLSLLFLVSLIGYELRIKFGHNELLYQAIKTSLRQGFWIGIYVAGVLGLAAASLLTWWDAVLLALSLILFEIYFKSSKEIKI